jgi:hypothetical protein
MPLVDSPMREKTSEWAGRIYDIVSDGPNSYNRVMVKSSFAVRLVFHGILAGIGSLQGKYQSCRRRRIAR